MTGNTESYVRYKVQSIEARCYSMKFKYKIKYLIDHEVPRTLPLFQHEQITCLGTHARLRRFDLLSTNYIIA